MSVNCDIINQIFKFNICNSNDVFDCEIFILDKIVNECDNIGYMVECYKKIRHYGMLESTQEKKEIVTYYYTIIQKYFYLLFNGKLNNEHKLICRNWISKNKFDFWDVVATQDNICELYYDYASRKTYDVDLDTKLYNIRKLCLNPHFVEIFNKLYETGSNEERYGPFSWISHQTITYHNFDIVYDTMKTMYREHPVMFIDRINYIAYMNKSYSYYSPSFIQHNSTSSFRFIYMMTKLLLKLSCECIKLDSNIYNDGCLQNNRGECTELDYDSNDPIEKKLICLTLKFLYMCYNVTEYIENMNGINVLDMNTSLNIMVHDIKYSILVNKFIPLIIMSNIYIGQELLAVVTHNLNNRLLDNNLNIRDDYIIIRFIIDIVKGDIIQNPHSRYDAVSTLANIIDQVNLNEKLDNAVSDIMLNILRGLAIYIYQVDIADICDDDMYRKHFIDIASIIKKMDSKYTIKNCDFIYDVHRMIYKLFSVSIGFMEQIMEIEYENDRENLLYSVTEITKTVAILSNILDIHNIPRELILSILNVIDLLFKIYQKYGNIDDTLVETIQYVIPIFIKNKVYCGELSKTFRDKVEDIFSDHHDKNNILYMLNDKIPENTVLDNDTNVPDEFLDPLLAIRIIDPIMIPNVNLIFDKASIMSQLYHAEINPYTREELTIKQMEEYNATKNIKKKLKKYKKIYNRWVQKNGM